MPSKAIYDKILATSRKARLEMKARKGTSFLEYALLAALVGIVGAIGVMKYGKSISDFFSSLADKTAEVTPKSK